MKSLLPCLLLLAMSVSLSVVPAGAADDESQRQAVFQKLDKDNDGRVSLSEYLVHFNSKAEAETMFRKWDVNGDGYLNREEFKVVPLISIPIN